MQKLALIAIIITIATVHDAGARPIRHYVKFTGFDPVLAEQIKIELDSKMARYFDFKYVDNLAETGGINIIYTDDFPKCFNTVFGSIYNNNYERLPLMQVVINSSCIEPYQEVNKVNAFFNAINHEVRCHAASGIKEHMPSNGKIDLCDPKLSTAKIYFTKRDFEWIKSNLDEI